MEDKKTELGPAVMLFCLLLVFLSTAPDRPMMSKYKKILIDN